MSLRRRLAPPNAVSHTAMAVSLAAVILFAPGASAAAQGALRSSDAGAIPAPLLRECTRPSAPDSTAAAEDSLGMDDDSLPASALPPESGMVLIDRTGREVHSAPVALARNASSGSADRPRCAGVVSARLATAMKR